MVPPLANWRGWRVPLLYGRRREEVLRKKLAVVLAAALMLALSSVPAFAAANPSGTGKPDVECGEPGAESSPPGFETEGFANAEEHYNPGSQYDVACYQVSHKGGSNR
jgi:hypothetical protein